MNNTNDIADLLEEIQTIVQALRDEKTDLRDQVNRLESQSSLVKEENTKDGRKLQETNVLLRKELQDTKDRLSRELQETKDRFADELQEIQQKLDRFHPELQSLQDELQNAEFQNNLLEIELSKKDETITSLEDRLNTYTSLASTSSAN
jgi:chromosome segregation ATPase